MLVLMQMGPIEVAAGREGWWRGSAIWIFGVVALVTALEAAGGRLTADRAPVALLWLVAALALSVWLWRRSQLRRLLA